MQATEIRETYNRDGFCFPLTALSSADVADIRGRLEAFEAANGGALTPEQVSSPHLLFTWLYDLIHHPRILDAVEAVIGPDILCWSTSFFTKEPGDGNYVSWHQDATYWGLEPHDQIITAWVALSDVPVESGAMKFLAGSHRNGLHAHADTFHENNLLSRGQEIQLDVDEDLASDVVLKPGEFSLHHVLMAHGSHPNTTTERRIGFAIRYIPTTVRQTKVRDTAVLVRGEDRFGHFDLLDRPDADMSPCAIATHKDATDRAVSALMEGTEFTNLRSQGKRG